MLSWTFLVFLGMAGLPFHSVHAHSLFYTYTCYPNSTITISGMPTNYSSMYYFAMHEADGKNCSVTGILAAGTAEITECDKDQSILFTFSPYIDMSSNQIHAGEDVEIVNITCFEIPDSVPHSISNTLAASIALGEEATMNVSFDVTSVLNPTSANVGDPVTWTIIFPMNYTLQITSCTAYPGTTSSSSNSVGLITTWCSDDSDLISNFTTNANDSEATAIIQAFRFFDYNNVYLSCDLLICPLPSSSCTTSCSSAKRKRRSTSGNQGEYRKSVGKVLHIIDSTSAASTPYSGLPLSFLLTYLVSLLTFTHASGTDWQ
ncbi:uncharacterized protein LOC128546163 [Mercenaria mercenaria]|uniref:uncharacterized protein LOC128546163 n=1 Tax=Mercenaria mercenaria TaxID=6596 RepID=UPI00234F7CD3|nr:uncharacterized protein LOC128546163 [Mercenaria mercenaria]